MFPPQRTVELHVVSWDRACRFGLLWGTGLAAHTRSFSLFCVDAFFLARSLMP